MFGSGMTAATTAFLALERPAHVVAPLIMYWALKQWLAGAATAATELGLEATFVDTTDIEAVRGAMRPGHTRMVWIETPSNPLWGVSDIAAVAAVAHEAGALLGVDSTVATPVLSRPLALGADIVMHSATKYLNGHSDVLAGALCFARQDAVHERAARLRSYLAVAYLRHSRRRSLFAVCELCT
jgi:cystathionine gamma-synthase